jgi:hypothetical protein
VCDEDIHDNISKSNHMCRKLRRVKGKDRKKGILNYTKVPTPPYGSEI